MTDTEGTVTLTGASPLTDAVHREGAACLHLVLLWSRDEPQRVGECCALSRPAILGRGTGTAPGEAPKLEWARVRPGSNEPTGALASPALSRTQWTLTPAESSVEVQNSGKRELVHNGVVTQTCRALVDDTIGVVGVALFLVTRRPRLLRSARFVDFEFGAADSDGIVGESVVAWALRRELQQLAGGDSHTLILGESGCGKELCAQAIHRNSRRCKAALISRNAATIPPGLVEAELFGQVQNYPNAGVPARRGLIGEADGGTLLLDEIGEIEEAQQARLLRVLDAGEYQRLGEDRRRRSDLRMLAATNRAPDTLKPDVLARFPERLHVPGLNVRRADVPLLGRNILQWIAKRDRLKLSYEYSMELVDALVRHSFTHHYRELERLIRLAIKHSSGEVLGLSEPLSTELELIGRDRTLDAAQVRAAVLETTSSSKAAQRLGLSNRFALYRVMKRLGIEKPDA